MSASSLVLFSKEWNDTASLFAYCQMDETVLMSLEPSSNEIWLPSRKIQHGCSWIINDLVHDIFGIQLSISRLLRLVRVRLPGRVPQYLTHTTFEVIVPFEIKKKVKAPLGKFKNRIQWMLPSDLSVYHAQRLLRSPEIFHLIAISRNNFTPPPNSPADYFYSSNYCEINQPAIVTAKSTPETTLIVNTNFDTVTQEAIYVGFLNLCSPTIFMSYEIFNKYMISMGWSKDDIVFLFNSADVHNRNALSYREFLTFLAASDATAASLKGVAGDLRSKFIFRFYDRHQMNQLKKDDLKLMFKHMLKGRNAGVGVDKEVTDFYKGIKQNEKEGVTLGNFIQFVNEGKFKFIADLYVSPVGIKQYISTLMNTEVGLNSMIAVPNLSRIEYNLGAHCITLKDNMIDIDKYNTILAAVSSNTINQQFGTQGDRKKSDDYFNSKSQANELLKTLNFLIRDNIPNASIYSKIDQIKYNWGAQNSTMFASNLKMICDRVKEICMKESRLLELSSPVYVMGDLHGNITDLLQFERTLWPLGPGLCPSTLLFLGDCVDRGVFSVEVVTYLLCYKLLAPEKIKLIRGNHEIRRVQQMWTFETECRTKFGEKNGSLIFEATNDVFDVLPLAAVIDGRVFCCHGGIPPPWLCPTVQAINDIPVVLKEPLKQSSLAWELMWNDPIRLTNLSENMAMEIMANEGFADNVRRGTGHFFTVEALDRFLVTNGFTHLIRAHEVAEAGFNLEQNGKLFTIFSTSKYCNSSNEAACILADQGKLRVLRLNTSE